MATCIDPTLRRFGFGFVDYSLHGGLLVHRLRLGLVSPVLPTDDATVEPEMLAFAQRLRTILPNNASVLGAGTLDTTGGVVSVYSTGYPLVGTHADGSGAEDWYARTITMTGVGRRFVVGGCHGQTRFVMFVGKAFNWAPGTTSLGTGADTALDLMLAWVNDPLRIVGSDFYGQKAFFRPKFPVQFNAYVQRKRGS